MFTIHPRSADDASSANVGHLSVVEVDGAAAVKRLFTMAQTLVFLTSVPVAYERKDHFVANQLLNHGFDFGCLLDSESS